jgi:hypothetical protein
MTMTDETPLTTTAASAAVREAFEAHYADLVEELTPVGGNEAIATQAVDEAFRRAAALPDFAEYGRPREWLAVMARNHLVRKPFRREDLEDSSWERSFGGFERPTLAASLERARAARRKELVRGAGLGAAAVAVGVALAVAVPQLVSTASPTSPPAAAPSSSSRSSPPLIHSATTPRSSPSTEDWPPPIEGVIGHPSSTIAYTVVSSDTPSHKATVWQRCRYQQSSDSQSCEMPENRLHAVEVVDGMGHRTTQLLGQELIVRPAAKGAFAIVPMWGGSSFELISPTMEAKPFTIAAPVKPAAGQVFIECDEGPCLVDLRGVVTPLDLPVEAVGRVQWHWDTSQGWIGWTDGEVMGTTVYIQQSDGSFGSVAMTVPLASVSSQVFFNGRPGRGGAVVVSAGNNDGFAQVAVSTDRGRTWQIRWAGTSPYEPGSIDWRTLPVSRNPAISIGRLKPVR